MAAVETIVARDAFTSSGERSRIAALPLALLLETPADSLAEALRSQFGAEPLDYLLLAPPVSLADDWRENNVDHAGRLLSAWDAMGGLVELGVTRAVGIANAGEAVVDLLLEHASVPPALDQIEFHPYLNSEALVRHCRDRGVAVHALRCLGPLD